MRRSFAKPTWLAAILASALLTGCARHYVITLNNGNTISTQGKPKLNPEHSAFLYKDAKGKPDFVAAGSVKEISRR